MKTKTKDLLSIGETAMILGISNATLGAIAIGSQIPIKFTQIGKRRFFALEDVMNWIERRDAAIAAGVISRNNGQKHKNSISTARD